MSTSAAGSRRDFPAFLEQRAQEETIVILGSQGSGTNLLVRIVKDVFGVIPTLDRSLILDAATKLGKNPTPTRVRRQINYVCKRLDPGPIRKRLSLKHYHRLSARFTGVREQAQETRIESALEFSNFFYSYGDFLSGSKCKAIKSDDIWDNIDAIPQSICRPRLILLVRDPRDTAISISKKNFGPKNLYMSSRYVEKRMTIYRNFYLRNAASNDLIVRYEDLLARPEDFCRAFAANFDLAPVGPLEDRIAASQIRRKNSEKWRQLSPSDLHPCECTLRGHIEENGYELNGNSVNNPSNWAVFGWRTADIAHRVPQKLGRLAASLRGR